MQSRNFLLVLNNPDVDTREYLEKFHKASGATYTCGQLEKAKTPHIQFFVNFKAPTRCAKLKKIDNRLHIDVVKINNGAHDYCMKEDTRLEGPFEFGKKPMQRNNKTDWTKIKQLAQAGDLDAIPEDIYIKHYRSLTQIKKDHIKVADDTESTKGIWIYGRSGIGKS